MLLLTPLKQNNWSFALQSPIWYLGELWFVSFKEKGPKKHFLMHFADWRLFYWNIIKTSVMFIISISTKFSTFIPLYIITKCLKRNFALDFVEILHDFFRFLQTWEFAHLCSLQVVLTYGNICGQAHFFVTSFL